MHLRGIRRGVAGMAVLCALGGTGVASAAEDEGRGIDPHQGESLVEVGFSSKGAAMRLQLAAEDYGVEFNEHYLRRNSNGTVTATVFGTEQEIDGLAAAGYDIGATIEGPGDLARADRGPPGRDARREPRAQRRRGRHRSGRSRTRKRS